MYQHPLYRQVLSILPINLTGALINDKILLKQRLIIKSIIITIKAQKIKALVLGLDTLNNITKLTKVIDFKVKNLLGTYNKLNIVVALGQQ